MTKPLLSHQEVINLSRRLEAKTETLEEAATRLEMSAASLSIILARTLPKIHPDLLKRPTGALFTDEQVVKMRECAARHPDPWGKLVLDLATQHKTSKATIRAILVHKTYQDAGGPPPPKKASHGWHGDPHRRVRNVPPPPLPKALPKTPGPALRFQKRGVTWSENASALEVLTREGQRPGEMIITITLHWK